MLLNSTSYATTQPGSFPETFGFDKERMISMEEDLNCMTSITALLTGTAYVIKERLKQWERAPENPEQREKHNKTKADGIAEIIGENVKDCKIYNLKEVFYCFLSNSLFINYYLHVY